MRALITVVIGLSAVMAIALFVGYTLGLGKAALPIFITQGLVLFVLTMVRAEFGIFTFLILDLFEGFLPEEYSLAQLTDYYVFGLNPSNAIIALLFGSWLARFLVARRGIGTPFLPMGRLGWYVAMLALWQAFSFANGMLFRSTMGASHYFESPMYYAMVLRGKVIVSLVVLVAMQSDLGAGFRRRLEMLYLAASAALLVWSLEAVASSIGGRLPVLSGELAQDLRAAPLSIEVLVPVLMGFCLAMSVLSRKVLPRLLWLIPAIGFVVPVAYMGRRGTYLFVVVETLVVTYLLSRKDARHRWIAPLIYGLSIAGAVVFIPVWAIERTELILQQTSAGRVWDPSVALRFDLWGLVPRALWDRPWAILVGYGVGMGGTAVPRIYGHHGLSIHNMWLEAFLDGGFVGVFLTIGIYVEVYRLFRAAMMSAESNLTAAYMVSLAAGVIGVQSWLIAHSMRFGGDYATMMLVFSAAVVVGMRPGGMFARMPLHDGRIGMEYLGYDPDDHPEDQAEDPTPDNPSIPPFPDAGPLPGIWQGAGNVTR